MDSEITVVIPSYNPGSFLIKALQSVYEQTYSNWRIILVDDCSTDNSLELVKELTKDPRVTVIKNSINLGQSKAENIALDVVETPYFIQLDSDDWFMPDTLETVLKEFKRQLENVAVVSGNIVMVNEETNYLRSHDNQPGTKICRGRFFKDKYDFMLSNASVWPRCYRTSTVKRIGGWPTDDPYGGRHMEDKLILYRLAEAYNFHWIDKVLYAHRRHDNNYTNKLDVYNDIFELTVRKTLKRWGDEYNPVFTMNYGWKLLDSLTPNKK